MTKDASRSHDLSERLVRHAAGGAPAALRERLEEEWLADLQTRQGFWSRLRFAAGCGWASKVIAVEHPQPAFAGAGAGRLPLAPVRDGSLKRRSSSLMLVVGLHGALFYAAWTNLSQTHKPAAIPPLVIKPIPPPTMKHFRPDDTVDLRPVRVVDTRPPEVPPVAKDPKVRSENDGDKSTDLPPTDLLPPPPHTVVRVAGAPAAGFPNVDDFYPDYAIRRNEQGSTAVRVCVNPQGRLDAEPSVAQSSGSTSLDAAALKLAKAGSGHYRPSTEDGRAVTSCFAYAVRFQIRSVH